jgi:salicylate hydroxylase
MVSIKWDDASLRYRDDIKGVYEKQFGAPYLLAHRGDLHRLFREQLPDSCLHTGKHCIEAETRGDVAMARFADGGEIEADVILGADGIRSAIRQKLFGADQPRYTEQMAWRAIVPIECVPRRFGPNNSTTLEPDDYHGWIGPNGHIICYPIGKGDQLNIFGGHVSVDWVEESWTAPSSKEEFIAAHEGWNEALIGIFENVGEVFKWGIFDRDPRPEWQSGRIVLLGDAAHPTMPTLAQGANMAIEDGWVIGACLDRHRDDPKAGLAEFVLKRQPRTARVTLTSRQQFANNRKVPPPPPLSRDWIFEHDVTRD